MFDNFFNNTNQEQKIQDLTFKNQQLKKELLENQIVSDNLIIKLDKKISELNDQIRKLEKECDNLRNQKST